MNSVCTTRACVYIGIYKYIWIPFHYEPNDHYQIIIIYSCICIYNCMYLLCICISRWYDIKNQWQTLDQPKESYRYDQECDDHTFMDLVSP